MDIEIIWWYWVAFGLVLLVVDLLLVSTFYMLWLGLGAVLVGVLMLAFGDINLVGQVTLWGLFSLALISAWIFVRKKGGRVSRPEAMIGITGVIMDWSDGKGRVRFQRPYGGADIWNAKSSDQLAKGNTAKVTAIDVATNTVTLVK